MNGQEPPQAAAVKLSQATHAENIAKTIDGLLKTAQSQVLASIDQDSKARTIRAWRELAANLLDARENAAEIKRWDQEDRE